MIEQQLKSKNSVHNGAVRDIKCFGSDIYSAGEDNKVMRMDEKSKSVQIIFVHQGFATSLTRNQSSLFSVAYDSYIQKINIKN
ncbi:MAG: hypothetical protein AAGB12_13205 [Pseudomonadota bacterium]